MDETKTETTSATNTSSPLHGSRIQPRRSSRSTMASSPTTHAPTKEDRHGVLPTSDASTNGSTQLSASSPSSVNTGNGDAPLLNSNTGASTTTSGAPTTTATANHQSRVTRSLSADSNSTEESPNSTNTTSTSTATITNGKRRRHTSNSKAPSKKKTGTPTPTATTTAASMATPSPTPSSPSLTTNSTLEDTERETRNTSQRLSKEAKDTRRAGREIIVKRKLGELEALEEKIKNETHEGYQTLLEDIQTKRTKKLIVAQGRHAMMASNFKNGFLAQKKSAEDQFYLDKLALRRTMIHQVQQKINRIEQEYFSSLQQGGTRNLVEELHLNEWAPPDRPSMISSLTLGLDEQQVDQDFAELQDLLPTPSPSIEDHHPLDPSKKDPLPLIPSS